MLFTHEIFFRCMSFGLSERTQSVTEMYIIMSECPSIKYGTIFQNFTIKIYHNNLSHIEIYATFMTVTVTRKSHRTKTTLKLFTQVFQKS